MRKTIGLDVSPLRIGWAVLGENCLLETHGTIAFNPKEWVTPGMRAARIEDTLDSHDFQWIGLEAVFVGPNKLGSIRSAMALGQVESICDYLWPDAKQKVLTPSQWRSYCDIEPTGKGPVMDWAIDRCRDSDVELPETQDAADAIAISFATIRWFAENE